MGPLHNRSRHGVTIASVLVCLGAALLCDAYITFIAVRLPLPGDVAAPGAPWPLPQRWVNSTSVKTLNPDTIQFVSNADSCDVIVDAFARYKAILKLDASATADAGLPAISIVNVVLQDTACGNPDEFMNENHTITIGTGTTANIHANSIWGALRGLETFSQLLYISEANTYHINETAIADWPRFAYRGLMIDTARHFLTVNTIKNIMDGMSYDKLNVLHWHIVDDQSFPFELRSFPNMTTFGAYSPYHTYNATAVAELIQYARLRGIRIIPEFDTPGHTWSWGQALPKLITPCWGEGLQGGPYVPNYPVHGPAEILNPIEDYTYNVLAAIYADITNTFPGSYVHLGLDEAYYACWQSNPNITVWMAMMGYTDYAQVETYYQLKLIQIVRGILSNRFIIWQDPIDNNADVERDAIVEIWKDASANNPVTWEEYMLNITKKGYSTILSAPWYLNYISYGQDWRTYYLEDPLQFTNDTSLHSLVLGGEACMWAEYIDGGNILSTLWHRLSAVSERLWSDASVRDVDSAAYRLDQHRCRYVRRGIPAKPVLPGYCGNYEWENL